MSHRRRIGRTMWEDWPMPTTAPPTHQQATAPTTSCMDVTLAFLCYNNQSRVWEWGSRLRQVYGQHSGTATTGLQACSPEEQGLAPQKSKVASSAQKEGYDKARGATREIGDLVLVRKLGVKGKSKVRSTWYWIRKKDCQYTESRRTMEKEARVLHRNHLVTILWPLPVEETATPAAAAQEHQVQSTQPKQIDAATVDEDSSDEEAEGVVVEISTTAHRPSWVAPTAESSAYSMDRPTVSTTVDILMKKWHCNHRRRSRRTEWWQMLRCSSWNGLSWRYRLCTVRFRRHTAGTGDLSGRSNSAWDGYIAKLSAVRMSKRYLKPAWKTLHHQALHTDLVGLVTPSITMVTLSCMHSKHLPLQLQIGCSGSNTWWVWLRCIPT